LTDEELSAWFRRAKNNPDYTDAITFSIWIDQIELTCVAHMGVGAMAVFLGQHDISSLINDNVKRPAVKRLAEIFKGGTNG
jgi:hypothetical protein